MSVTGSVLRALSVSLIVPAFAACTLAATTSPPAVAASPAGSVSVGSTAYPVPAGAIYARPGGATGGSGTSSSPYQSAQTAVDKAKSGATIVLRGGLYHESLKIPFNKKLVIQSAPHEAVWFDGSSTVTGWAKSGSTWRVSGWNHIFDNKASLTPGADESKRYLNPAYPLAAYPDQVWLDGVEQTQVASAGAVTPGTFYVDRSAKRLVLGSDPTGHRVEASTLTQAIKIQGAGTTIRGIGVRRYATPMSLHGAISYEVNDLTFENMVVADNATVGFWGWGDRATFRNVTIEGNGLLGLHGDRVDGMRVTDSVVSNNNDQHFRDTPEAAGAKLTNSPDVRVTGSVFSGNKANGLWFDLSMRNVVVTGNRMIDNTSAGIEFEVSGHAIIADNYIARNGTAGVFLFNANDVQFWNNTLERNARSIQVLQDERRQPNSALASSVPWVTNDIDVHDNVIVYGTDVCPMLTQDLRQKWFGNDFDIQSNGNVFHRTSSTSPSRFACWANGSAGTKSFPDLDVWRTNTRNDGQSKLYQGAAIVTGSGALTPATDADAASVPLGLPGDVAAAIGRRTGERKLGAYLVR